MSQRGDHRSTHRWPRSGPIHRPSQAEREALRKTTGSETIPTLVSEDGTVAIGEEAIRRYLDEQIAEPAEAEAHRLKAAKARRRYLEEECECLQPATR